MNNKLIEKSIAVSARPYMYILTVMLFLLSCGSDNNTPTEDLGNTTNHYLKLQPSGFECNQGFLFRREFRVSFSSQNDRK